MSQEPLSDEEIIARERRSYRNALRKTIAMAALLLVGYFLLSFADDLGFFASVGLSRLFVRITYYVALVIAFAWFAWLTRRDTPPKEALSERIIRKQLDEYQMRSSFALPLLLVLLLQFANYVSGQARPPFVFIAFIIFIALILFFPRVRIRPWRLLDDELTVALRGKSVLVGYLAVMGLLGGLYIAIFYSPALAIHLGPFLLVAGIAIPTLYFLFLQWQAGRSG